MSFPRDSSHLCASSLDLAFVQRLLERQLMRMKHGGCLPESHLSVPPWRLEHCLDTGSPDPTQGPSVHTGVYSAVLHPTFNVDSRIWSCLKPFSEYFARKNHLWLKWSQLLISVGSAWAQWILLATFIYLEKILLISLRRAYLDPQNIILHELSKLVLSYSVRLVWDCAFLGPC